MAIQPITKMGTPTLLEPSKPVDNVQLNKLEQLIQDLADTQQHHGGAGIAAPQIGVNLRVILFGFDVCERYPERKPISVTVLINPEFEPLSDEQELGWEGCLSVPGIRGAVNRYKKIRYWGQTPSGEKITREVENFHARVVQHEIDHLNGVLFVHRIANNNLFGFEEVLAKHHSSISGVIR